VAFTSVINRWADGKNPSEISEFWGLDRIGGAPNGIWNPWKCVNPNPNVIWVMTLLLTLMIRWNWHVQVSVTQVSRMWKFLAVHSSYMFILFASQSVKFLGCQISTTLFRSWVKVFQP
jgi:hypothetical protein